MSDAGPPSASRQPRIEQRSLLLWGGAGAGLDLARLPRDVVGAIALPLRRAAAEQALLNRARRDDLGLALPGEAWRNQLEPRDRGDGFAGLPYALVERLDLERDDCTFPAGELAEYAELFLDAQLAAGASIVTTPAHRFARELGCGREHDLALARASVAVWRERQAWRPPPQRPADPPRRLYAGVAVDAAALAGEAPDSRPAPVSGASPRAAAPGSASPVPDATPRAASPVPLLIDRYAALPVDGYWLTVFDGDDSAERLGAVAALALGLQEASGRPVVLDGAGDAWPALLASGLAAICTDVHSTRPSFPPPPDDHGAVTAFALPVFHPAILGEVPVGPAHDAARTRLFATSPCRCGEHLAYEPPRGRRATLAHNAWCLAAEAREATGLLPVFDEASHAARRARADRLRERIGLPPLPAGWATVAATAARVRAGPPTCADDRTIGSRGGT